MRNIASKALAQVWSDIHEGMEFKTPDDRAGKLFSVQSVDEDSILVLTEKGMTEVRLGRAAFLEAIYYLLKHNHDEYSPCEIRSNNDSAKAGPLCLATRNVNNNVRVINYIAPILAGVGLLEVDGKQPNTVWTI